MPPSSSMMFASPKTEVPPSPPTKLRSDVESQDDDQDLSMKRPTSTSSSGRVTGKHFLGGILLLLAGIIVWDACIRPPEERVLRKDASDRFLLWVEQHPSLGIGAFLIVMALAVVFLIPLGTPLTVGCGYIYKDVYGWHTGIFVATFVAMLGSGIGSMSCFLLGRYMMRDRVRLWIRKYPLFDAIDTAVSENGLRIMAMLHLTPILPLGPVSYLCGTTSMMLWSFAVARVASLPLMLLYVFVGASTGTLLSKDNGKDAEATEKHKAALVFGMVLSVVMIGMISYFIRKELNRILERQKQANDDEEEEYLEPERRPTEESVEMGMVMATQRHPRSSSYAETEGLLEGDAR